MHVIIFYACALSVSPSGGRRRSQVAETKEKNKPKKTKKQKPMCTEEELYRKKKKTKPLVMPSRERDINNTKLHTLSGNA